MNTCSVRFGYAHMANNRYDEWQVYAVRGSANPTIFSEGNYFMASTTNPYAKQVTKRESQSSWQNWKWRSSKDVFKNGWLGKLVGEAQSGWGSSNPLILFSLVGEALIRFTLQLSHLKLLKGPWSLL
ncbi:Pectate lyase [Trema orientale]|uniref:Pectate lyase n=1 Tax=Trema orientale TaxID=63057 RepID=A0A2P5F0G3_TREOI|nr:Pectate lyase [Trema orientale]